MLIHFVQRSTLCTTSSKSTLNIAPQLTVTVLAYSFVINGTSIKNLQVSFFTLTHKDTFTMQVSFVDEKKANTSVNFNHARISTYYSNYTFTESNNLTVMDCNISIWVLGVMYRVITKSNKQARKKCVIDKN